jgi:hypothetical protein
MSLWRSSIRQCRQGRRRQDLAARQGQRRSRYAAAPCEACQDVYRRRLQLRRADRRATTHGYSHALLGIFDAIAPAAARYALWLAAKDDGETFHGILGPTVPLSRHIFRAPTRFYKTGVVFMAYLNGHQDHFTMVGGQESTRSTLHLAEIVPACRPGGLLADPEVATRRMRDVLARGIEA